MTSNGRSSSKNKDEGSNGLKKKVVNGTGSAATGSGASPQNTRRSERFVKRASVSLVSNRKSERISKEPTPSPLRSDRGKKQISSGSSGSKKSEKVSVAVDLDQMKTKREKSLSELTLGENNKCEDINPGCGKRQAFDGRTLFKRQSDIKAAADMNGISPSERDGIVEVTSANAGKLGVDCSREEQGQTPEVEGSKLIRKSHDDGIAIDRGDNTKLSKRKIDLVVDLDAYAIDGKRCAACSKRQRFCDGRECKISCNVSCSNHSTDDAPAGVWHCSQCLNNKMQADACSLPGSVEAICNAREAEVSDAEGLQKDKQNFVKYGGLAHTHNQWIPESRLLRIVQYYNDSPKQADCEAVEVGKKRKKGGASFSPGLEQDKAEGEKIAGASDIPEDHGLCCLETQDAGATDLLHPINAPAIVSENSILPDAQKNFHVFVKTSVLKLCEILKLSDGVKNIAEQFLEYVISNHQVSSDSKNILQAFLMSLCWSSASLLNQKVDRKGSLIIAQKHLNFICNEKEAQSVYNAVRKLKKAFKENVLSDLSKDNISGVGKSSKGTLNEKTLQLQNVKLELEGTRDQVCCTGEMAQDDKTHKVDEEIKLKMIQETCMKQKMPLHRSGVQNEVGCEHGSPNISENVATLSRLPNLFAGDKNIVEKVSGNTCVTDPEVNVPVARSKQPSILDSSTDVNENTGSFSRNNSKNQNPEQNLSNGLGNTLELETPALESHGVNDRVAGVSSETPNVLENHTQSGVANSSVPACNQLEVSVLQVFGAEKVSHVKQSQLEISTISLSGCSSTDLPLASGSAPRSTNERDTSPQNRSENTIQLSGQAFSLAGQIAEENHPVDEQNEISQQSVEHPTELPNQRIPLLGANVELHPPTYVIETPLQQNQPDMPSSSTLDHQLLNLGTYLLNSEAVPQVNESTIELPRQAVLSTRVNMSVQGFSDLPLRAEHQVPSRIPKATSYSDPLQNQLEGIRKETEQVIKLHEEAKMRLKFEFEEFVAQLRRNYEAKCKDAEAAFLWKKKELDKNHNKVLVNKILTDAFRSKCTGMQAVHPGLVQHLNQLPSHNAPRPSPVTVASSGSQPAATQLHTTLLTQPEPGNNLVPVSSSAGQPATYQQNTEPLLQPSPMISPILSSSGAHSASSQRVMPSHLTPTSLPASSSYAPPCSAAPNMPPNYSSAVYNKSSPQSNAAKDMLLPGSSTTQLLPVHQELVKHWCTET